MLALGVDTSNYATSLAVVDIGAKQVLWAAKRFLPVAEGALGLRQSDAVFHHTKALPALLAEAPPGLALHQVGAVAASSRPRPVQGSYMPCFLAGVSFASAFAAARGVPLLHTSHQEGHLAAALFEVGDEVMPGEDHLFIHLSGGTTEWWQARGTTPVQKLGGTLDVNAGQVVDRLGVRLGHAFPAGAAVSALAAESTQAISPKTSVKGLDCSFSGLQNQC
ncbi:MAG: glycoprotease, partial [Oscillospiraceae bacterium]